jgi:hypothetical protein
MAYRFNAQLNTNVYLKNGASIFYASTLVNIYIVKLADDSLYKIL